MAGMAEHVSSRDLHSFSFDRMTSAVQMTSAIHEQSDFVAENYR